MRLRCLFVGFGLLICLLGQAELPELIPVRIGTKFGYCDPQMNVAIPANFQDAMPFVNGRAVVKQGTFYGLINTLGHWIIAPEQDEIVMGRFVRLRKSGKYALADFDGCQLTEYVLDGVYELKNGFVLLDEAGRKGLLNAQGQRIVPSLYEQVSPLRDDQGNYLELFSVREGGRIGLFNACGEQCLPAVFDAIGLFQEGFAVVQRDGKFGMIDAEGHLQIPCEFEQLQGMSEGLAAAKVQNRWGFIDRTGKEVLPFIYEAVQEGGFFQGRVAVNRAGAWLLVHRSGEVDFSLASGFQYPGAFSEGLMPICELAEEGSVRFGYADSDGKMCIPVQFERAEPFHKGFAIVGNRIMSNHSVVRELRFGIIDNRGRTIVPIVLQSQTEARLKRDSLGHLGFTTVSERGRNCRVDHKGRRFGCEVDHLGNIQKQWVSTNCEKGKLIAVVKDDRWGFCDLRGKLLIPCQYASVHCFSGGLARVWEADSKGSSHYIDEKGKAYILPES
jgi:hypothetical protein